MNKALLSELFEARNVLIAGAGGGFDVLCGLPIYFWLLQNNKNVYLANYSFSSIRGGDRKADCLIKIDDSSRSSTVYFPEKYLDQWFFEQGFQQGIYCFDKRPGCNQLRRAYELLICEHDIDTVILTDSGATNLLRYGVFPEQGMDTSAEVLTSIAALNSIDSIELPVFLSTGVGRVGALNDAEIAYSVNELMQQSFSLGQFALPSGALETELFREVCQFVLAQMPSKIGSAIEKILFSIDCSREANSSTKLIDTVQSLFWCFYMDDLAEKLAYLPAIEEYNSPSLGFWESLRLQFCIDKIAS